MAILKLEFVSFLIITIIASADCASHTNLDSLCVIVFLSMHWLALLDIADVTHFVRPETAIDIEASIRCTTVYLVDKRIDMLPCLLGTSMFGGAERYAAANLRTDTLERRYRSVLVAKQCRALCILGGLGADTGGRGGVCQVLQVHHSLAPLIHICRGSAAYRRSLIERRNFVWPAHVELACQEAEHPAKERWKFDACIDRGSICQGRRDTRSNRYWYDIPTTRLVRSVACLS
jgi:hypothetical protein